ncbi:nuclear transport factor 2 family protein [Mucilaginibacter limnophilus]|uniref:Nuclear transport factor 2 family protein n=1 Tax=Mucilaginibacter limnophilus TaxID=1932778 RepID=A0A437MUB2_9SPHI|nr:nuclear transport factor 2 family protein [Mucilaginibacter limnophilus]RVU01251.1 nuclear transport factor 2 family protein [Mucilaginibacter limnophilus]
MKKTILAALTFITFQSVTFAQKAAQVQTVIDAEQNFQKLIARKGIKDGFLAVADPEGIVFKPNAVNINQFYGTIDKQPGKLTWEPKIARIAANGDLAFTAGPYVYQNSKNEEDKVYGQYVSVWRTDASGKLKLLIDAGIQHPEPEKEVIQDIKDPDASKAAAPNKDPFKGKNIILATDRQFNNALLKSTVGSYKEFLSPEGRFYFPGFEPMTGQDQVMRFVESQAIFITAETVNAGRAGSNDLAFSHGTARIKKGNIVSNFNYVRIWEIDKDFKWNMILEIFSAVEN